MRGFAHAWLLGSAWRHPLRAPSRAARTFHRSRLTTKSCYLQPEVVNWFGISMLASEVHGGGVDPHVKPPRKIRVANSRHPTPPPNQHPPFQAARSNPLLCRKPSAPGHAPTSSELGIPSESRLPALFLWFASRAHRPPFNRTLMSTRSRPRPPSARISNHPLVLLCKVAWEFAIGDTADEAVGMDGHGKRSLPLG